MLFLQSPTTSPPFQSKHYPQHPVVIYLQPKFFPQCQGPSFTPTQNYRQNYNFVLVYFNSVISTATGYGLDDGGGQRLSPGRVKNFLFSMSSGPALWSTQPPIKWVPGALSPGVKQLGCEADHSSTTRAKVKKMWIYISTPPYAFMASCLTTLPFIY
jgi:hypothetical protein